jgi:hypothetical protein
MSGSTSTQSSENKKKTSSSDRGRDQALGKLATHDVLKTTHLTKTAPIFAFSLPCNSVLSNCAYISYLLPCNSVFWSNGDLTNSNTDKGSAHLLR